MKKIPVFLVLVLLAALPAAASARGSLDRSFGTGGRVLLPGPGPFPPQGPEGNDDLWTASAPGGQTVVLAAGHVLRFLADGKPDPSFGVEGSVAIAVGSGRGFAPVGIAVDSQGRVLVAGTSTPPPGTPNRGPGETSSGPTPTRATVIRYLPNGDPDPSFGSGGLVTTSFDLPAPTEGPYPERRFESAVVEATALALTPADQPVVAGTYATFAAGCYIRDGYVARLDAAGGIDRSFGKEGVVVDSLIKQPELLAQSPLGVLFYSGLTQPKPVGSCLSPGPQSIAANFAALLPSGQPDPGFGGGGQLPHDRSVVYGLAIDSRGRLVTLEQTYSSAYPEGEGRLRVGRLLPTGAPDPAFGKNGFVWPKATLGAFRRVGFQTLAIDGRNRILLAGGGKTVQGAFGFQLMRLGTKGRLDLGFGRRGRVKTGFGASAETKASTVVVDGSGRAVLGGSIAGSPKLPSGYGFAFARYSP